MAERVNEVRDRQVEAHTALKNNDVACAVHALRGLEADDFYAIDKAESYLSVLRDARGSIADVCDAVRALIKLVPAGATLGG